ncbi:hypothetical protein FOA52_004423 [Chlamydomonas sp. UWO 241]|nr:hypothetical protein FOA52_004423 [Chlamydomonas sp. UWO 241]
MLDHFSRDRMKARNMASGGPDSGGSARGGAHSGYPPFRYSDYPRQSSFKHDDSDDYHNSSGAHQFGNKKNAPLIIRCTRTLRGTAALQLLLGKHALIKADAHALDHRVVSMMAITRPTSFGHRDNQVHAQISSSTVMPSDRFVADFSVSRHITSNMDVFTTFAPPAPPRSVFIGNGLTMLSAGEGSVLLESKIPGSTVNLERVLYVPDAKRNPFSVSQAERRGTRMVFVDDRCQIVNNGKIHLEGTSWNGRYLIDADILAPVPATSVSDTAVSDGTAGSGNGGVSAISRFGIAPSMTNYELVGAIVDIIERSSHENDSSNRPELTPERALVSSTTPAPVDTIVSEPAADNSSVGASLELKTAHALVSSTTSDDTPRDVIDEIPNVNKSVLMLCTPVTIIDGEDDYTKDVYFPEGFIHASDVYTLPDISEPMGALPPHIVPVGALLPHAPPVGAVPLHRDICVLAKLPGGFSDTDLVGD